MNTDIAKRTRRAPSELPGSIMAREDLVIWLGDVRLADSALNFPQTEGFLFAVACCPAEVDEVDWLSVALGDVYSSSGHHLFSEDLPDVCATLCNIFVDIQSQVADFTYRFPKEYSFSWDAVERCLMEQWCEGMLLADEWLSPFWIKSLETLKRTDPEACARMSEELDDTVGLISMLADIDNALECLEADPEESMSDIRQQLKEGYDVVDHYLFRYMQAGQLLAEICKKKEPVVRSEPKLGRNDPCTCGSGLKYKKCCMVL